MMNGSRSARSGDSRTRRKPPMSNTGALTANKHIACGFYKPRNQYLDQSLRGGIGLTGILTGVFTYGHRE